MYRCLNDLFGYCGGKPDFTHAGKPKTIQGLNPATSAFYAAGNQCHQNHRTCGRYKTLTQIIKT